MLQCTPRRAGTAYHRVFRPQAGKTNDSGAGDAAAAAAAAATARHVRLLASIHIRLVSASRKSRGTLWLIRQVL